MIDLCVVNDLLTHPPNIETIRALRTKRRPCIRRNHDVELRQTNLVFS